VPLRQVMRPHPRCRPVAKCHDTHGWRRSAPLSRTAVMELRRHGSSRGLAIGCRETAFDGAVHSVFAHACNVDCGEALLTLAAATLADGPTMLMLSRNAPADLRSAFRRGDPSECAPAASIPRRDARRTAGDDLARSGPAARARRPCD